MVKELANSSNALEALGWGDEELHVVVAVDRVAVILLEGVKNKSSLSCFPPQYYPLLMSC